MKRKHSETESGRGGAASRTKGGRGRGGREKKKTTKASFAADDGEPQKKKARWRDSAPRTIVVANLPRIADEMKVRSLVSDAADVQDVRLVRSGKNGKTTTILAFVVLKFADDVLGACEELDGAELLGRRVRVNPASETESAMASAKAARPLVEADLDAMIDDKADKLSDAMVDELFDSRVRAVMIDVGRPACETALRELAKFVTKSTKGVVAAGATPNSRATATESTPVLDGRERARIAGLKEFFIGQLRQRKADDESMGAQSSSRGRGGDGGGGSGRGGGSVGRGGRSDGGDTGSGPRAKPTNSLARGGFKSGRIVSFHRKGDQKKAKPKDRPTQRPAPKA